MTRKRLPLGGLFCFRESRAVLLFALENARCALLFEFIRIEYVELIVVALARRPIVLDLVLFPWEIIHVRMTSVNGHHHQQGQQ